MFDVVVLTQAEYINPSKVDWYVQNVLDEDNYVLDALASRGLKVCKKDWADPSFDWSSARSLIFRTTWDYFDRYPEFAPWLARVSETCLLFNSADIIKWNIDKNYLSDLMSAGLNVAPTEFLKRNSHTTLVILFEKTGWPEAVLKPAISGAARHTYRLTPASAPLHEAIFSQLLSAEDMLFQEFLNDIVTFGEISLMFMGGRYTHAVRKIAKTGDFRVQDDHGGQVEIHEATPQEIEFGHASLSACPFDPIYARIDIVRDNSGNLSLCELELIEPELWFRNNPSAAVELAKACILALT
jgi:glutathione synthase/RimK-type ligase-like ATP-grasp enzyme